MILVEHRVVVSRADTKDIDGIASLLHHQLVISDYHHTIYYESNVYADRVYFTCSQCYEKIDKYLGEYFPNTLTLKVSCYTSRNVQSHMKSLSSNGDMSSCIASEESFAPAAHCFH